MTKEHKLGEQEPPALGWRATGWNITDGVIVSTIQGYFWLISSNGEEFLFHCGTISPLIKYDPFQYTGCLTCSFQICRLGSKLRLDYRQMLRAYTCDYNGWPWNTVDSSLSTDYTGWPWDIADPSLSADYTGWPWDTADPSLSADYTGWPGDNPDPTLCTDYSHKSRCFLRPMFPLFIGHMKRRAKNENHDL